MSKVMSKGLLMTALICGNVLWGGTGVYAEEALQEYSLDTMVVTATRTMKQIQEVPSSISVVTAKDIEAHNVMDVEQAIQRLPGVYMDKSASGSIQLRGMSTTNVLVLVDGQQMNSTYNGGVDLKSIPVETIERIEVLRGAASSIYGGHAVAGVINITTKEAKEKGTHMSAALSYGSNNTWKKALQVNSKVNDKWSFGLGYEQRKSDGYKGYYVNKSKDKKTGKTAIEANLPKLSDGSYIVGGRGEKAWTKDNYNFNVKYNFDESKSLKYLYSRSESKSTYKNAFSYAKDAKGNPVYNGVVKTQDGNTVTLATRNFLGTDNELVRDTHGLIYKDEDNKLTASFNYVNNKTDGFTSPTSRADIGGDPNWTGEGDYSSHPGKVYDFDIEKAWDNIGKHSILIGANFKQEEMTQDRYNLARWHDKNSITSQYAQDSGKIKNMAFFVQDEYKLSEPLSLYLGARFDHFEKGSGKFWNNDTKSGKPMNETSASQSYNEISPKVAFDYKADDKTHYFVSYGHSFNPPPLYQIYRYSEFNSYWYIPNPELDPETSDTFEIGMKKELNDNTNLNISLYHVKTDDKIAASGILPGQKFMGKDVKKYMNYDSEKRNGIEFELTHKFSDKISGYFNYAWQQGKLESKGVETNNYDIPKHLLHAGVEYNYDKWNALLDCQYVSARQEPSAASGEYGAEDAFFLVDFALNYKLNKNMTFQFGIDNLFDREFYCSEAAGGRTYNVGLRYSF